MDFSFGKLFIEYMMNKTLETASEDNFMIKQMLTLLKRYGITGTRAMQFMIDLACLDLSDETDDEI